MVDFSSIPDKWLRELATQPDITNLFNRVGKLDWRRYTVLADAATNGGFATGRLPMTYLHEVLEAISNVAMYQYAAASWQYDKPIAELFAIFSEIEELMPTATHRDFDRMDLQQFSTPMPYALCAAAMANLSGNDLVFEPSAGTGRLVGVARPWCAKVLTNELDRERNDLIESIGLFHENFTTSHDARWIHQHYDQVQHADPDVILMNPPFSVEQGMPDYMTAAKHVEAALQLLAVGGRLVAILPGGLESAGDDEHVGMSHYARRFQDWWHEIASQYTIRCNVGIDGDTYKKMGTTTRTRLVVIDKVGPMEASEVPVCLQWLSLRDMMRNPAVYKAVFTTRRHDWTAEQRASILTRMKANRKVEKKTKAMFVNVQPVVKLDPILRPIAEQTTFGGTCEQRVTRLLYKLGLERTAFLGEDFHARVESGGYIPLVIERQPGPADDGHSMLYLTHYLKGSDDELYIDSEMVFDVQGGYLRLLETAVQGLGQEHRKRFGGDRTYANMFSKNLLEQGFAHGKLTITKGGFELDEVPETTQEDLPPPLEMEVIAENPVIDEKPVSALPDEPEDTQDAMDVFQGYRPWVHVALSKPHNVALIESNAMKLAKLPRATAPVHLPRRAVERGDISSIQIESVVYAVHAHHQRLRDGVTRKAFMIGDGTGVGKGVQAATIAMHYKLLLGKVKVLWVSKEFSLIKDAKRDWTWIGGNEDYVKSHDKFKDKITVQDGIVFTTYSTASKKGSVEKTAKSINRVQQIIDWQPDLILWDESHLAGNATSTKGERGTKSASQRGLACLEIQDALPDTRIVYLSATAATEVHNLAYAAKRLGLCGPGVDAFPTEQDFIKRIKGGGMLAMELVAKDMKSMGLYVARSLSYEGTEFELIQHELLPHQRDLYDECCYYWRLSLDYIRDSFNRNNSSAQEKATVMSQYWGTAQRFFNQLMISMQAPTAIDDMLANLRAGHAVVVQLVNTNEASTERAVADALLHEMNFDDLDLTPRDALIQYVQHNYPLTQFKTTTDSHGNIVQVPLTDSDGKNINNAYSEEIKAELLLKIHEMRTPPSALDYMLERMFEEGFPMAEITGRTKRYLMRNGHRTMETRSKAIGDTEGAKFMNDEWQALCFSGAGNTGRSYQSDKRCKNQRRRIHYVLQAGWVAAEAIQGMGRTHRTNQANEPLYKLVTTDLPGQKRFITSIARRIEQLGSLTKGNRKAASNDMFNAEDNLETTWAMIAIKTIFMGLYNQSDTFSDSGFTFQKLADDMGFFNLEHEDGGVDGDKIPGVTQFLNRLLILPCNMQDRLFALFDSTHRDIIEEARQSGLLDMGLEKIKADRIEKINEQLVYSDMDTKARTNVVHLQCTKTVDVLGFDEAMTGKYLTDNQLGHAFQSGTFRGWVKHTQTQKVYGVWNAGVKTTKKGEVIDMVRKVSVLGAERIELTAVGRALYSGISESSARVLWTQQYDATPRNRKEQVFMITGAVLPVWDKLGDAAVRILVAETETGERILGREIAPKELAVVLSNLNANTAGIELTTRKMLDTVILENSELHLSNGWKVKRRRFVTGYYRYIVEGPVNRREVDGIANLKMLVDGKHLVTQLVLSDNKPEAEQQFEAFTQHRPVVRATIHDLTQNIINRSLEKARLDAIQEEQVSQYSYDEHIVYHTLEAQPEPIGDLFTVPKPVPLRRAQDSLAA